MGNDEPDGDGAGQPGRTALALGNVSKWADRVDTSRFTPLRAQRERTTGVIEAGGTLAGDPTLGVVDRAGRNCWRCNGR